MIFFPCDFLKYIFSLAPIKRLKKATHEIKLIKLFSTCVAHDSTNIILKAEKENQSSNQKYNRESNVSEPSSDLYQSKINPNKKEKLYSRERYQKAYVFKHWTSTNKRRILQYRPHCGMHFLLAVTFLKYFSMFFCCKFAAAPFVVVR